MLLFRRSSFIKGTGCFASYTDPKIKSQNCDFAIPFGAFYLINLILSVYLIYSINAIFAFQILKFKEIHRIPLGESS